MADLPPMLARPLCLTLSPIEVAPPPLIKFWGLPYCVLPKWHEGPHQAAADPWCCETWEGEY